jgi:hypothetical protein
MDPGELNLPAAKLRLHAERGRSAPKRLNTGNTGNTVKKEEFHSSQTEEAAAR